MKSKVILLLLLISSTLAGFIGYFFFNVGRYPVTKEERYFYKTWQESVKRGSKERRLKELTNFDWDTVSIDGPYSCPSFPVVKPQRFRNGEDAKKALKDVYYNSKIMEVGGDVALSTDGRVVVAVPWCQNESYATMLFLKNERVIGVIKLFSWNLGSLDSLHEHKKRGEYGDYTSSARISEVERTSKFTGKPKTNKYLIVKP